MRNMSKMATLVVNQFHCITTIVQRHIQLFCFIFGHILLLMTHPYGNLRSLICPHINIAIHR